MSIRTLNSREVYRNPWMRLREDEIERSNGEPGIYGVVEKDDSAIIIALDGDQLHMVEQFRYAVQKRFMEFPQGGWEAPDIDPEELARGELREETGLVASSMQFLGTVYIAYGYANQKQHIFLATGLTRGETDPDPEEHDLVLRTVSVTEFEQMILAGDIPDVCTLAAWAYYKVWRQQEHFIAGSPSEPAAP